MPIAPPASNSSASSTTDIAPTYSTSKVLDGHQPSIPGSVSDKYKEGMEDPSKRPKENIHAQEDFIKSLPRKDVSFGAEASLDRDRVPLVKRTEVHAVPAETSQENLLKDKHIEVSDVQIPPTQSQSQSQSQSQLPSEMEKEKDISKDKEKDKENMQPSNLSSQSKDMSSASKQASPSTSMSKQESKDMSAMPKQQSKDMSSKQQSKDMLSKQESKDMSSSSKPSSSVSPFPSISSKQESSSMSSKQQEADQKQDAIQASTESFKDNLSKQDKQLEASATQHQQSILAEKKKTEDTNETETPQFKDKLAQHNKQVEKSQSSTEKSLEQKLPTHPTKELQTDKSTTQKDESMLSSKETQADKSTANKWEQTHVQPFDIPRTSEQASQTREKPTETNKSSGVLPTDQYDLKSESDSNKLKSDSNKQDSNSKLMETIKSSESVIQEKLAGLVHVITHDLPTAARELLNEYEASKAQSNKQEKSSSDAVLPTDQYDLKPQDTQKDATASMKDIKDKVQDKVEGKHVEPLDDHKSEPPQQHFIQEKLAGLMHTVTHDLPARAKELLSKHEENKSQPPSPTQAPTVQEREEKQMKESPGSSSIIKERGLEPEDMLFL